jgi:DNA mismatch repair protein MutS2
MQLYPPDAEARLGFDRLRERLDAHARTPYGRERLAALVPSAVRAEVERRLAEAGEMQGVLGFDDPFPLEAADDLRPTLRRVAPQGAFADGEELAAVARVLATLRRLHAYVRARATKYPALWRVGQDLAPLPALEDHIARVVDDGGRVRDDASPELMRLTRAVASRQGQLRDALMHALRDAISQGWATEEQPTVRGGRAVIPVRAEARRKVQGFVHDVSATGQTVYIEPAAALDLNNELRELEAERRREVERLLREVSSHLRAHLDDLAISLDVLGRLDAIAAAGRLGNELDALVPELNDRGVMRLVRAKNPVLLLHVRREAREAGQPARAVVPLDLALGEDFHTLVVTGPNAGGKSVAMKSVGVLALMAQCGLPVPAAPGTTLPVFSRLFVDLGDRQSIQDDLSTFTSHLTALREMLATADERSLVLIDEAGTGTDPAEGGALAEAALARLTRQGARTVATTHHGTLKAFAHRTPGVANGSMVFDRDSLAPTYRFQPGVPGSSYAFEIAARVGLDAGVVADARRLVGEGQTALDELVAEMEARTQEAAAARDAAQAEVEHAARARAELEARLSTLRAERDRLRAAALAEAEGIVRNANAEVERVVREIREAEAEKEATREARARLEATREAISEKRRRQERRQTRPAAPRRTGLPRAPAPEPVGPLAIGDQVRLDAGETVGEIVELGAKEAVVAFGALVSRVKPERLTKVGGPRPQRVEVRAPQAGPSPALTARTRVDVRGQRVDEALMVVEKLVDEASSAGVPSVEVLHGKGTGALRAALREALAARPDVSAVESAAWNQGGDGVTVVRLG